MLPRKRLTGSVFSAAVVCWALTIVPAKKAFRPTNMRRYPESDGSSSWATASPIRGNISSTSRRICGSANPVFRASFSISACRVKPSSGLSEPGHAGGAVPTP